MSRGVLSISLSSSEVEGDFMFTWGYKVKHKDIYYMSLQINLLVYYNLNGVQYNCS